MELGPDVIMATDYQSVAAAALEILFNVVSDDLEMLHGLVRLSPFGVPGIIAAPTVALAASRKLVDEVQLLDHVVVHDFKDARLGAVYQHHACVVCAIERRSQRLQMEALIKQDVRLW